MNSRFSDLFAKKLLKVNSLNVTKQMLAAIASK